MPRYYSEELVLAAEDLGHRVVGEDPADRVGQQVRARQDADEAGRPGTERDRVGDDDLLEARGLEVLERAAAEDRVRGRGEDALGAGLADGLRGGAERAGRVDDVVDQQRVAIAHVADD